MPDFKIIGNPSPTVGEQQTYSIQENLTLNIPVRDSSSEKTNPFSQDIHWSIYQLINNKWILKPKNNKTGSVVNFNFFQATLKYEGIKLIAKRGNDEAILYIKTQKSIERKIVHVDFLDENWNKPTRPFAYGDKLIARVHCVNLNKCAGSVTLWEDDAPGSGHSIINKNNKVITLPIFIEEGKAEAKFFLAPDFAKIANSQVAHGDKDEGEFHEYYVTVEIFNQKTFESENVNIKNPEYEKQQSPAEKKGTSQKETKGIKSEEKIYDYLEQKIVVKPDPSFNPIMEKYDSIFKVDVGDSIWNRKNGTCACKENNFYWSSKLTCDERKKVLEVCSKLWGEDKKKDKASELMAIMHLETGEKNMFKPYADNGADYSGLIQFSDDSAKKLGTTRAELKKMTFIKQMNYVHDYFASKKEISNIVDLYLHVLKPNAVGNGNNPDYVLFDESISVPDGDGSQTSLEQRKINIGREPWVTKYGYSSNPSFMKGEEHTQRKKWVYTKQRFEDRWGFINGKTTVADVMLELKEMHFNPGAKYLFTGVCENIEEENDNTSDRAPWMEVVVNEAKIYGGKKQNLIQDRITMYHKEGASYLGKKDAWCSSFACWCLENSNPNYPSPHSPGSRSFINNKNVEKCEVFYGAIATFSDCNKNGIVESSGHVTFVYGKINGTDNYAVLGGNQNNMIKVSSYDCSGNVFHSHYSAKKKRDVYKKFMGFFKPKGYEIKTTEKLTASDMYSNPDEANKAIGLSSIKTVKGEKDD